MILDPAKALGCGDSLCYFVPKEKKTGMLTSGGCRCLRSPLANLKVKALLKAVEVLTETNRQSRVWFEGLQLGIKGHGQNINPQFFIEQLQSYMDHCDKGNEQVWGPDIEDKK